MKKLFIFFIPLLVFNNISFSQQREDLPNVLYTPFFDLLHAVNTYKKIYDKHPENFKSLTELKREDYLEACYFNYSGVDTTIVPRIDYYLPEKTTLTRSKNGLKINFSFSENIYSEDQEEILYSPRYATKMLFRYGVFVKINSGSGYIELPDSNKHVANVNLQKLKASLSPHASTAGQAKKINIDSNRELFIETQEAVCVEVKTKKRQNP